jgi:hypothetical protein
MGFVDRKVAKATGYLLVGVVRVAQVGDVFDVTEVFRS